MVDKKTVEYVARLSRLKIDPHQTEYLAGQLSEILSYIDKLKELDVSAVEPMRGLNLSHNVFRQDKALPSSARQDILSNAPQREGDYFKIPKVIE
jgi:aspartyl-tRNA(Asn)/glutamyl-tRNA(Gln) amidotransferase subunit C